MKPLSPSLISCRATAMRLLLKYEIILHITHFNTSNNFGHSLKNFDKVTNFSPNEQIFTVPGSGNPRTDAPMDCPRFFADWGIWIIFAVVFT